MVKDRRLAKELFDAAQALQLVTSILQFGVFFPIVGILYFGWDSIAVALATMFIMIIAAIASYLADEWQQLGNALSDILDYSEAFGVPLSAESIRPLMSRIPGWLERRAKRREAVEEYFNSPEPAGPRRALEMYAESAWWSSELSRRHELFYAAITLIAIVVLFLLMYAALILVDEKDSRTRLAQLVANIITLLISLGFGRLALRYRAFQRASEGVSRTASTLGERSHVSHAQALALMHQYQLARAGAPPLHSWIWLLNRARLNNLWREFDSRRNLPESENT